VLIIGCAYGGHATRECTAYALRPASTNSMRLLGLASVPDLRPPVSNPFETKKCGIQATLAATPKAATEYVP
jgi:hypothetical protein